jgi:hypothetical protein
VSIADTISKLWHNFWALPLWARITTFAVTAGVAWLKRKALAEVGKAVKGRFWGWMNRNLQSQPRLIQHVDLRMVEGSALNSVWGIGARGNMPTLVLHCVMNFAHTENLCLVIKRAYVRGTQPVISLPIKVFGPDDDPQPVHLILTPIIVKPEQVLKRKIVFIDQFNNEHVSPDITFMPKATGIQSTAGTVPHCIFCGKAIKPGDQPPEAEIPAHRTCIWP